MSTTTLTLHATTIAIEGQAVLLCGPSGAGKSDLALRLIDRGAILVSDDQTIVTRIGDRLIASPPVTIAGLIEVRGLGIVAMPYLTTAPIAMRVDLSHHIVRMPEPAAYDILGLAIFHHYADPMLLSAPIILEMALRHLQGGPAS